MSAACSYLQDTLEFLAPEGFQMVSFGFYWFHLVSSLANPQQGVQKEASTVCSSDLY